MEKKDIIKSLVTAVLTAIVGLVFKYIDPPTILTEIWQRVFVGIWFAWLGAAGFGFYWFVRLLIKLHHDTTNAIPALFKAQKALTEKQIQDQTQALEIFHTSSKLALEQEKQNRVEGDNTLSSRLNALDTRVLGDLNTLRQELRSELAQAIQKETHQRTDGINALIRQSEAQFERINKIETMLPMQITAVKNRLDKVESSSPKPSTPAPPPRIPSPLEALIDAARKPKD